MDSSGYSKFFHPLRCPIFRLPPTGVDRILKRLPIDFPPEFNHLLKSQSAQPLNGAAELYTHVFSCWALETSLNRVCCRGVWTPEERDSGITTALVKRKREKRDESKRKEARGELEANEWRRAWKMSKKHCAMNVKAWYYQSLKGGGVIWIDMKSPTISQRCSLTEA